RANLRSAAAATLTSATSGPCGPSERGHIKPIRSESPAKAPPRYRMVRRMVALAFARSGEEHGVALGQEQALAALDQALLVHRATVAVAVEHVEDGAVPLVGVVRLGVGRVGERPRAARVGGGGRVRRVGAAGGLAVVPDDEDVGGAVAVGQ